MPTIVSVEPKITPRVAYPQPPPEIAMLRPPEARQTRMMVSQRCSVQEWCLRWRRKTGKRPKTSMLNRVREKTCAVVGKRDASTVLAISAAFVDSEAGNLVQSALLYVAEKLRSTHFASGPAP